MPPSINRIWRKNARSNKGVYRSPEYIAWLKAAWVEVVQQKPGKVKGPYRLIVRAGRPDNRKRDIGNLEKGLSDFLQGQGIVEDDSLATQIDMAWGSDVVPGRVHITIIPDEAVGRVNVKKRAA